MRLMRTFVLLIPILVGCGGSVEVVLKSPIEKKCGSAGLKGCPELTEGVIVYVGGDEAKGKDLLTAAAASNAPAKVKKFAKAVKELHKIPGADKYTAKLTAVADIILAANKGAATAPDEDDEGGAAPPKKGGSNMDATMRPGR